MTSYYKNKSELYLDAADALMKAQNGHYAVVPHSAYYSCLLLIEHKCYIENKKTEDDIRPEVNGRRSALHEALISYIKCKMSKSTKQYAYRNMKDFTSKITVLKKLHVKADYKNENVSFDDSQKSLELANDILDILKKI